MGETVSGKSLQQTLPGAKLGHLEAADVQLTHHESSGPDLPAVLDFFHPGTPNGKISFFRKPPHSAEFLGIGAVDVRTLRTWREGGPAPMLPGLLRQLLRDVHFTINAMVRSGVRIRDRHVWITEPVEIQLPGRPVEIQHAMVKTRRREIQRTKPGTHGLLYPHRAEADSKWLPQCWVDVDGYKAAEPTDGPGCVANILRAHRAGLIPTPSFILASGQGAWGFWQIVDERNPAEGTLELHGERHQANTPCRGSRYAIRLQHTINVALASRLAAIGADAQACDGARCCRVPGSRNSANDAIVEVLPVLVGGAMRVYTLSDLESDLGLVRTLRGRPPKDVGPSKRSEAQRTQQQEARRARHRRVYDAILKLSDLRGGLDEHHRNYGLFYLALYGHLAGLPVANIERTVRATGHACRQDSNGRGITDGQIRSILRSGATKSRQTYRGASYSTIAAHLGMTSQECSATGLVKRQRHVGPPRMAAREAAILTTIEQLGLTETTAPSSREMAALLRDLGIVTSHNAIAEDYRRLGLTSARRGGRRPPDLFSFADTA